MAITIPVLFVATMALAADPAAPAKDKPIKVGVFDIRAVGSQNPDDVARADKLAEVILTEVSRAQGLKVIGSSDIAQAIGAERQKKLLGCSEESSSCMAEIAGALDVDYLLVGGLGSFQDTHRIDLKVIATSDNSVISRAGETVRGSDVQLIDVAAKLAREVILPIGPRHGRTITFEQPLSVPFKRKAAYATAGVGAAALLGGAVFGTLAYSSYDQAKVSSLKGDAATYDRASTSFHSQARMADILLGAGVVAMGVGTYLFLTSEALQVTPYVEGSGGGFAIAGRF